MSTRNCLRAAALVLGFGATGAGAAELNQPIPAPAIDVPATEGAAVAVLAGGCFWGQQGLFEHVRGVRRVVAGYAGGSRPSANYRDVSSETTEHAEAVEITYDPAAISYGALLRIFFSVAHDPTEVDRQGPDRGPSYRSAIFAANAAQERAARAYVAQLDAAGIFRKPIATRVTPLAGFFPAEDYHQDYMLQYPQSAYIRAFDLPKLAALERVYPNDYRDEPVTLPSGARTAAR